MAKISSRHLNLALRALAVASSLLSLANAAHAEDNRIASVWTDSMRNNRCSGIPVPPDKCKQGQDMAVAQCNLNGTEQAFMRANGVLPMCFDGQLLSVCSCGCFDAGTKIAVEQGGATVWQSVESIDRNQHVLALSDQASLQDLTYAATGLRNVVKGPEEPLLYNIATADGNSIVLSQHHGVVLGDGTMTTARQLKLGDELVRQDGAHTAIVTIVRQPAKDGNVYNVLTDRDSKPGHLILANGYVVGDLMWQNTYQDEIGAVALRN